MKKQLSSDQLITLEARAADISTEVFITDGRFHRIAGGVGRVETEVAPGIYKVRFRAGDTHHDELVEVTAEDTFKVVEAPPVSFESAVPIEHTGTSREYHAAGAWEASMRAPQLHGSGSHLLVFSRELKEKERTRPWTGVSIHNLDDSRLADLGDGERDADARFGAIHIEVDPGIYRLRVETGEVGTYEMFVTTTADWQTQVFLLADDFWGGERIVRRPSLNKASVLMARPGEGFQPDSEGPRLAELARQGLGSGRDVVRASDLSNMLWAKYSNPMMGIYGAHLMLHKSPINHDLLETVIHNLTNLLGPHPDVLSLQLRPGITTPPRDLLFPSPPMLRHSWDLISQATRRRAGLVPAGSYTDQVADELIGSRPWLLHRVETGERQFEEPVTVSEGNRLLAQLIERASSGEGDYLVETIRSQPNRFSPLEKSIASVTIGGAIMRESARSYLDQGPEDRGVTRSPMQSAALKGLDAPASAIARSTKSLTEKLNELS